MQACLHWRLLLKNGMPVLKVKVDGNAENAERYESCSFFDSGLGDAVIYKQSIMNKALNNLAVIFSEFDG